jgi:hypothetical protein
VNKGLGAAEITGLGVLVEVFKVDEDGVNSAFGRSMPGIDGKGVRASVYMSRRMLDKPTIADGWSEKWTRADSNSERAV